MFTGLRSATDRDCVAAITGASFRSVIDTDTVHVDEYTVVAPSSTLARKSSANDAHGS